MGVDLYLLPEDSYGIGEQEEGYSHRRFSHTILDCCRRSDLFMEIGDLPQKDAPENFRTYLGDDNCYGPTNGDAYTQGLKMVTVDQLLTLCQHEEVLDNWKNRAIWAYLACLPLDLKVVLYWH